MRTALTLLAVAVGLLIAGIVLGLWDWNRRAEYLASHGAGQRDKQYAANVWIYTFGYEYYANGEAELITTRVPWDLSTDAVGGGINNPTFGNEVE